MRFREQEKKDGKEINMPNWCENDLYVSPGMKDILDTIKGEEPFDFNKLIPYPKKWAELDKVSHKWWNTLESFKSEEERSKWVKKNPKPPKDGYNSGGYKWCIANWGTKWNACDTVIKTNRISFQTPWGPPLKIISELSARFPKKTFTLKCFECGMEVQGRFVFKNGLIIEREEKTYRGKRGG
jgi:hypothetical protein